MIMMFKKNRFKLPNSLTCLNIILPFLILFNASKLDMVLGVYISCRVIDVMDGYLARLFNSETKFGACIDRVADYFLFSVMAYVFWPIISRSGLFICLFFFIIIFHATVVFIDILQKSIYRNTHNILSRISSILNFSATVICLTTWTIPLALAVITIVVSIIAVIDSFRLSSAWKLGSNKPRYLSSIDNAFHDFERFHGRTYVCLRRSTKLIKMVAFIINDISSAQD